MIKDMLDSHPSHVGGDLLGFRFRSQHLSQPLVDRDQGGGRSGFFAIHGIEFVPNPQLEDHEISRVPEPLLVFLAIVRGLESFTGQIDSAAKGQLLAGQRIQFIVGCADRGCDHTIAFRAANDADHHRDK